MSNRVYCCLLQSALLTLVVSTGLPAADPPRFESELVFPLNEQHNHAPGIAELPDGELFVSWYRGSGERSADDVAVYGARREPGQDAWTPPALLVDTPGFPDCNTCLMLDDDGALWLFWPVIIANSWESCLTHYLVADDPAGSAAPEWTRRGTILIKPDDFEQPALEILDGYLDQLDRPLTEREQASIDSIKSRLGDKLYQRLGWQPRCKPTVLSSGRILLPLYSDTYSFSIMAISDDGGETWFASQPLMGFGGIQPAVLQRRDGTLVAYMRENGPRDQIRMSESTDDGLTWGPVGVAGLPNPGSGLDGLVLSNGVWLLVYNDTIDGRNSLAVSLSDDEGRVWSTTRHLEQRETGAYHYPAVIQGRDGTMHAVYSYFVDGGKSMKHAAFNEAWVRDGDASAIRIDGAFDDWAMLPSYTDPEDDTHDTRHDQQSEIPAYVDHPDVDLLEYKVSHDNENLYFYFRSRGEIGRTQTSDSGEPAGRYYVVVTIDVDDDDDTGYWVHEGGYYPTSRGYDVNAEIEFYDGQFNTGHYLNHGARNDDELQQTFLDQTVGEYVAGNDGPYPRGFMRVLPGTYDFYTQWVLHEDETITIVRDKGPVVPGIVTWALSEDRHEIECAFPMKGFLNDQDGAPIIAPGSVLDLSLSLEASGELAPGGEWASDTGEPIEGYVVTPK